MTPGAAEERYSPSWLNAKVAELVPRLREHFEWHLAAKPTDMFRIQRVIEHRADGSVAWTMTWAGIKEVVQTDDGLAVAIPKPHHFMLAAIVLPGTDLDTLAMMPRLARRTCTALGAPNDDRLIETRAGGGQGVLLSTAGALSKAPEMWSYSWPVA